jgi:hypothetical protein
MLSLNLSNLRARFQQVHVFDKFSDHISLLLSDVLLDFVEFVVDDVLEKREFSEYQSLK